MEKKFINLHEGLMSDTMPEKPTSGKSPKR